MKATTVGFSELTNNKIADLRNGLSETEWKGLRNALFRYSEEYKETYRDLMQTGALTYKNTCPNYCENILYNFDIIYSQYGYI